MGKDACLHMVTLCPFPLGAKGISYNQAHTFLFKRSFCKRLHACLPLRGKQRMHAFSLRMPLDDHGN